MSIPTEEGMKTIIKYINWMRIQGNWPGYWELIALNNLYGINILNDIIDIDFNIFLFRYNYKFCE